MSILGDFDVARDVVILVTAIIGSTVAIMGLRTWSKQLKGTYEYELARRLMLAMYKLQDAIAAVRNPFVEGEAEEVYQNRWEGVLDAVRELKISLMEAQTVWDKQKARSLRRQMDQHLNKLFLAIKFYLEDRNRKPQNVEDQLFTREYARILYAGYPPDVDEYAENTDKLIDDFEGFIQPHLKP
jgi:hypothetical protein